MKKRDRSAILAALPATQYQVCERCGISVSTASRVMHELLERGAAHVSGYIARPGQRAGPAQAVYSPGRGTAERKAETPPKRVAAKRLQRDQLTAAFFTKAPT